MWTPWQTFACQACVEWLWWWWFRVACHCGCVRSFTRVVDPWAERAPLPGPVRPSARDVVADWSSGGVRGRRSIFYRVGAVAGIDPATLRL